MKKHLALIMAAVLCCTAFLGACGGSSSSSTASTTAAAAETAAAADSGSSSEEAAPAESSGGWAPTSPVTVICPYGAGGGQDIAARLFAKYAQTYGGVNFVVDNQTGGSGTIGDTAIAMASPDGYTLGMFCNVNLYDQFVVEGVTYDENSFEQFVIFAEDSTVIVANKKLGVTTINELVDKALESPGEITWGGPEFTSQTYPRINIENATGCKFARMIFDGGATSLAAVAGGNCDVTSVFPSEYAAMADNDDLVVIATTGTSRMDAMPDVPTMVECGIDATFSQWRSYCLPAGADADVVAFYDDLSAQVMADEDFKQEMIDSGFNFIDVVGHEAATAYMMDDFNANKDAIIAEVEANNG